MKVGSWVGGGWLTAVEEAARRVEALGYDYGTTTETQHDSILAATLAAAYTERIDIQTSVTIAFPRSPMVLAMEAWELQHFSRGRFTLGLGSQVKGHNERRFSTPWTAAAPRMKEYIQTLRAIWDTFQTGAKPDFAGKSYQFSLMTPTFNPGPIEYPTPKIFIACLGDAMARVAGEVADGVLPHGFMTDKYVREVMLPNIAIGLKRSGRTWQDFEIAGAGFTVFGETESEIEQGLQRLRQPISFYGSTRTYHEVLALHGWEDLGIELHALSVQGKWEEMQRIIPEEVLRSFAQTSTYDDLPKFVQEHREYASQFDAAVSNVPYFGMKAETPAERERFQHVLQGVQKTDTPRAPRGLERL